MDQQFLEMLKNIDYDYIRERNRDSNVITKNKKQKLRNNITTDDYSINFYYEHNSPDSIKIIDNVLEVEPCIRKILYLTPRISSLICVSKRLTDICEPKFLTELNCSNNDINIFPSLKDCMNLKIINCSNNRIKKIRNTPPNLEIFNCNKNRIKVIHGLDKSIHLQNLDCSDNKLKAIPKLPDSLLILFCYCNKIKVISKQLPPNLIELFCGSNDYYSITDLPDKLETLYIGNKNLYYIDKIPKTVKELVMTCSNLHTLPKLEEGIKKLEIRNNKITKLHNLPNSLEFINADNNLIEDIDRFPSELQSIWLCDNKLSTLPKFNENDNPKLEYITISNNNIKEIPKDIPENLLIRIKPWD